MLHGCDEMAPPNMESSLATLIEFLFQPILVVLYGTTYFLFGEFVMPTASRSSLVPDLSVVLLALLIAFLTALLLKKVQASRTNLPDDVIASASAVALSATSLAVSHFVAFNRIIVVGAVGIMAAILVGSFVRIFFKVSGHMMMLSFVITGLVLIANWMLVLVYPLLFPVAWCRLHLKKHTLEQVIFGTILGLIVAIVGYWTLSSFKLL
jgi:membrane-associated phospholipid phosphatase